MLPNSTSYDWIFFDCFNTLLADQDDEGEAFGFCGVWYVAVQLGLAESVDVLSERYRAWRLARRQDPHNEREILLDERLRAVIGHDVLEQSGALPRLRDVWRHGFPRQTRLIEGVPAMLAYWSKHKSLAVVSNFYVPDFPRTLLERHSVLPYLSFVIDSAELGIRKPDPRMYQEALLRAKVSNPQRVLFVGDTWKNDVEGPLAAGMQAVWFDRGQEPRPDLADAHPSLRYWNEFR